MELTSQVVTFIMTIVTGVLLGLLFDGYRVLRGTFNPKALATWFADLLYWMVATAVVFIALVLSNWGELRFYVFIGILSGLGLYYNWLSLYVIRIFSKTVNLISVGLDLLKRTFISILFRPGVYCMRMTIKPVWFVCRQVRKWWRIQWTKLIKDEKK